MLKLFTEEIPRLFFAINMSTRSNENFPQASAVERGKVIKRLLMCKIQQKLFWASKLCFCNKILVSQGWGELISLTLQLGKLSPQLSEHDWSSGPHLQSTDGVEVILLKLKRETHFISNPIALQPVRKCLDQSWPVHWSQWNGSYILYHSTMVDSKI